VSCPGPPSPDSKPSYAWIVSAASWLAGHDPFNHAAVWWWSCRPGPEETSVRLAYRMGLLEEVLPASPGPPIR
jgi:hypothetical protein